MPPVSRAKRNAPLSRVWLLALAPLLSAAATVPDSALNGLQWRLVGPFRGGWGTVAEGIPDQPDTFYFGAAGGGVWKTIDAGRTWQPVFDGQPASNIGALAFAHSDPNTIYVGTGQVTSRYDIAAGNGVYKSTNSGKTWRSIGLEATRYIGAIRVDPRDANTLLVAALGHAFAPNAERGVFRSSDGGNSWNKTLFVDAATGAVDLALDPGDPNVVFAAVWKTRYWPWLSYFMSEASERSGIYKSSDNGVTWKRISGGGWPAGKLGRIGLAAAHVAGGTRVYALVDSEDAGGLYRSDDGGMNWQWVNQDKGLASSYFGALTVAPDDADTVYVMNRSISRCDHGGAHCEFFKGAPGGDDYHQMWINPKHPNRMVTASDQGTVVSVDGGASWSDWYNQPTGQFYHLAADNRVPYWIYSGQQDSGTAGVASRSDYGALSFRDWRPVGGDERDYDVPDAQDPDIVYGSGLGGRLSRWDARTGEVQNISPWPVSSYGQRPTDFKYRYTWITPIAVSQIAPYPLYQGAQVLFRSTDQGRNWETISPDLSAKSAKAAHCEGDLAPAAARDCGYGVVYSIGLSPRDNAEIWIGTDDGLVQLSRDGGGHWSNVTPKAVPPWAKIATVDVSALDPGTAYIAVDNHRQDEFRPHALRTHDYGQTWKDIADGLPGDGFVDVVRADPVKKGLLYAGTDAGVFVSFDDGDRWKPLQRNLPPAWVRDLLVHGDDLIVATQGRAIWVLDDVSVLRQMDRFDSPGAAVLFEPAAAIRVRGSQNKDTPPPPETPLGQNPPTGAIVDYWLPQDAKKVTLEIVDAGGGQVRRFDSSTALDSVAAERYFTESWIKPAASLSAAAGAHRLVWNLRYPRPRAAHYDFGIAAVWNEGVPIGPEGVMVPPGDYQLTLDVDGRAQRAALHVGADPRVAIDAAAVGQTLLFAHDLQAALERDYIGYGELQMVNAQLKKAKKGLDADAARKSPRAAIARFEEASKALQSGSGERAPNFGAIGEILAGLETDVEGSDRAPTAPQRAVLGDCNARLERAFTLWERVKKDDLARLNVALKGAGIAEVAVPTPDQIRLDEPAEAKDLP